MKIGVGLYGSNGHQIHDLLNDNPRAEITAVAGVNEAVLRFITDNNRSVKVYGTLEELSQDPDVQIVSLCSPLRSEQAEQAVFCMNKGKHVYAEKPCALTESGLDNIMANALKTCCIFHEMAGTAFLQPYLSMGDIVASGLIGEVIQIYAQKSYPYFNERPQDENVDGGLTRQAGVHALRFMEHVGRVIIDEIQAIETSLGNPVCNGGLKMASSMYMKFQNGAIGSAVINYLNPEGFGLWGNEHLRIFGTHGFVECTDGGTRTRLVIGDKDYGSIDTSKPGKNYFEMFLDELTGVCKMPLTIEEELHPTRMVIRAKESADHR